ncbi:MAG: YqaA family protein [bacterium]|nr:YqaA family protein [bacterium]
MGGLVEWVISWAQSPAGTTALFVLAFAESSFFPIPPDVLLISMALIRPDAAFVLALVCSAGSVLGGMFGYLIGWLGGRPLLHKVFSEKKIQAVKYAFEKYEVWAIAVAGFTPIPYKVFTLSAGTFEIPFKPFAAVSAVSRSARFFLVAGAIYLWGESVKHLLVKYFNWFSLVFMVLLIGGFALLKFAVGRHKSGVQSDSPESSVQR